MRRTFDQSRRGHLGVKRTRLIVAVALLGVLLIALALSQLFRVPLRFLLRSAQYRQAALWVVAQPAPGEREIRSFELPAMWRGLSSRGNAHRFRSGGDDFVYFLIDNDVTANTGLFYAPSEPPPAPPAEPGAKRLRDGWWQGGLIAAFLEVGRFE